MASKPVAPDLSKMSFGELQALIASAQSQASERRAADLVAVAETVRATIEESGFTLVEIVEKLGFRSSTSRKGPRKGPGKAANSRTVAPKYRHEGNTWTGRGKTPTWLTALISTGKSKHDFLIKR